jgi:hypothetical protein
MSREDWQSWAEAYDKEYCGFKECNAFKMVRPEKGTSIKIHDTLTRLEDNGTFLKRKVRLCARGVQQVEGESFKSSVLYAPTLKAPEARLLAAIAVDYGCPLIEDRYKASILLWRNGRRRKCIHPPT